MKAAGREGSAHTINTVVNGLSDFFGSEKVPITEIRAAMLVKYEKHLRSEREITRINQLRKEVTRQYRAYPITGYIITCVTYGFCLTRSETFTITKI